MPRFKLTLPGSEITAEQEQLRERIHRLILRGHESAGDAFAEWHSLATVAEAAAHLCTEHCYISYTHPVHSHRNRLSRATQKETLAFLHASIQPDRFSGLDIIVVPADFSRAVICNHDGGIFLCHAKDGKMDRG